MQLSSLTKKCLSPGLSACFALLLDDQYIHSYCKNSSIHWALPSPIPSPEGKKIWPSIWPINHPFFLRWTKGLLPWATPFLWFLQPDSFPKPAYTLQGQLLQLMWMPASGLAMTFFCRNAKAAKKSKPACAHTKLNCRHKNYESHDSRLYESELFSKSEPRIILFICWRAAGYHAVICEHNLRKICMWKELPEKQ